MGRGGSAATLDLVTRRNLTIDIAVSAAVLGLSLAALAAGGLGTPSPDTRDLDALGVLLAVASALPLLAWRLAPLAGYLATCAATIALAGLDYPLDFPFGPVVGLFTLSLAYSEGARRTAALVAAVAFVPLAAVAHLVGRSDFRGMLPGLAFWAVVLGGVWVAGEHTRLRRERIGELEEQAARRDREAVRERRLAAAEERTRIARELHDSAGHAINVILVQAGAARLLHERDPAASRQAIATIEDVARSTIGEIDQLVRVLRDPDRADPPVQPDPGDLDDLLARHRAGGLSITADLRGERGDLPRSLSWAAYRILQEALTNAARHGSGRADVAVAYGPEAIDITVTNPTANGSSSGGGHGIVGMRERASLLGGTLDAGPAGGIFRLYARLPHTVTAA